MAAIKSSTSKKRPASVRLRRQVSAVKKETQGMGTNARGAVQEQLGQLQENAADYYDHKLDQARDARRSLEQFIADQPLTSVLIATGVGLMLGRFWKHR